MAAFGMGHILFNCESDAGIDHKAEAAVGRITCGLLTGLQDIAHQEPLDALSDFHRGYVVEMLQAPPAQGNTAFGLGDFVYGFRGAAQITGRAWNLPFHRENFVTAGHNLGSGSVAAASILGKQVNPAYPGHI
jgi:hypothetical protein